MKKYLIPMVLLITSLISCNITDELDIPQQGVLPTDIYTTADDSQTEAFIAAIHYNIRGDVYADRFLNKTTCAINVRRYLGMMGGEFGEYFPYVQTAEGDTYKKMWSYYYTTIYWCNMIIENMPGNEVASPAVKDQAIAEARTIRAIMMMQLVQLWGNPPLADHIMTGEEGNTPTEESWAFITAELNDAAEGLPSKNGPNGQAAIGGRLTKEAAYAYLGKAYLWEGNYSEAASTLYNKVIASGLYSLVDDYTALNSYTSDFCSEYIWECNIDSDPALALSQAGFMDVTLSWGAGGMYHPDGYYDGQGWNNAAYSSESFGAFMENHDQLGNGTKSNRYRGTLASYEDILDPDVFSYSDGNKGIKSEGQLFCEGYFRVKLIPLSENIMGGSNWYNQYMHNNMPYMRYSEVLLNYAEAVAMGGSPGALSGLDALNEVRQRAGLDNAPALDMDNQEYGVKAERRAELYFEGSRFIDLVRWGDAATVLDNVGGYWPTFYGYENGNNSETQSKGDWKIVKNPVISEKFKAGKNELFPIPAIDRNNNPNLGQNPGW